MSSSLGDVKIMCGVGHRWGMSTICLRMTFVKVSNALTWTKYWYSVPKLPPQLGGVSTCPFTAERLAAADFLS